MINKLFQQSNDGSLKQIKIILVFVLLALVFRIGYIFYTPVSSQILPDSTLYIEYAENIANGEGMHGNGHYSQRSPVYPLFLASIFLVFGKNILMVQIIQILMSIFGIWILYKISEHYFGKNIAWITIIVYSFSYAAISQPGIILTEFLYQLFILAAIYAYTKDKIILSGLFFGIAYLARQEILIFIILTAILLIVVRKDIRKAIRFLVPIILLISIWSIRNYNIHKTFVYSTTSSYKHFYGSNVYIFKRLGWKGENRYYTKFPENVNEIEQNNAMREYCKELFRQQPISKILISPVLKFAFFTYPFLPHYDVMYMFLLPFWILGMIGLRKKMLQLYMIYGIFIVPLILITIFHGIPRFRHIFFPFISIFAAYSIYNIWLKGKINRIYIISWFIMNILIFFLSEPIRKIVKNIVF